MNHFYSWTFSERYVYGTGQAWPRHSNPSEAFLIFTLIETRIGSTRPTINSENLQSHYAESIFKHAKTRIHGFYPPVCSIDAPQNISGIFLLIQPYLDIRNQIQTKTQDLTVNLFSMLPEIIKCLSANTLTGKLFERKLLSRKMNQNWKFGARKKLKITIVVIKKKMLFRIGKRSLVR